MFFEEAKKGENSLFRYLLTFFITFIIGYGVLAPIPLQYVLLKDSGVLENIKQATSVEDKLNEFSKAAPILVDALNYHTIVGSKLRAFVLLTSIFTFTALIFWSCIGLIHKKRVKWILTGHPHFRWKQFWAAFVISGIMVIGSVVIIYIIEPEEFTLQFDYKKFIPLLLIGAIVFPIQAGWEEAFFRGWLMQGMGLLFKNRLAALFITSLLFTLVHMLNPEVMEHGVAKMAPLYAIMSLSFGIMVLMNNGLELALGYHIANNFFLSLFITSPESVLQTDSIFRLNEVQSVDGQWVSLFVMNVIVLGIFAWMYKWKNWKEKLTGPID